MTLVAYVTSSAVLMAMIIALIPGVIRKDEFSFKLFLICVLFKSLLFASSSGDPLIGSPASKQSTGLLNSNAKHWFLPVLILGRQKGFAFCGKRPRVSPLEPDQLFEKSWSKNF